MFKIMLQSTWNKGVERARQRNEVLFKTIERLTRECDNKDHYIQDYTQQLSYAGQENAQLKAQLDGKNQKFAEYQKDMEKLRADLAEARKNDQRDPETGRFVTAKELDAAKKS